MYPEVQVLDSPLASNLVIYEDYGDKGMWPRRRNGEEVRKLRKESIREEQQTHVLQQTGISLKRVWVTMGISCEIVREGIRAELEQTQCNILLIMYQ